MFMRVQYNFSKKKNAWDHIDLSTYAGMEMEHGLNTAGLYPESSTANLGHFDPYAGPRQNNYKTMAKNLTALEGFKQSVHNEK